MKESTPDPKARYKRFIEAARELGYDDDDTFDEMVKKVAEAPPPRQDDRPKPAKSRKPELYNG